MDVKCEACGRPAASHVRWGPADSQQGNLCESHVREVWDRTGHAAAPGAYWIQGSPEPRRTSSSSEGSP